MEFRQPEAGLEFKPETVIVTEAEQSEKLSACGLDPAIMSGQVDPSFYIGLSIRAGIRNGISAEGNINMLTRLRQHRPVRLGEELTFKGFIPTTVHRLFLFRPVEPNLVQKILARDCQNILATIAPYPIHPTT